MQAVVIREVGAFEVTDLPAPEPGAGEALVRVTVTGLCRTDLKIVRHGHRDLTLPRVPGEEVVGEIVRLGPAGPSAPHGTETFAPGDRVYVYPGVWCGECPSCRRGAENLCRQMRIMGFHRDGGFAEYVAAPLQSLIRVPAGLGDEEAVFAEPLSCCLNALELGGVGEGDVLGVWGAGPAGTLVSRAGALRGAAVVVVEPDARRRGALTRAPGSPPDITAHRRAPGLVDVAVVAVGDPRAYEAALAALAPRGRLVVFSGLLPADDTALRVSLSAIHYHEHTLVGAYGCSFRHSVEALDLLASRRLRVDDLISHRLRLAELDEGLDLVARRVGMKVHLYPGPLPSWPRPASSRPARRTAAKSSRPMTPFERGTQMTPDDTALRAFGADVQRLIDGQDLTRERTYELFRQVLLGEQPDLQQGALLAALVAKGETPEEIAGAWQAIVEFDTVPAAIASVAGAGAQGPLVENSGTGMDTLKTFNVSSAAAIVAAARGARLARHGARALTSRCGAVDILEAVGVDVDCDISAVERSIGLAGIGLFNGMSPAIHPGGLGRVLSQIRFGSTLNIAASLANPVRPTHGVRGVYAEGLLGPVGSVMMEIGYEHALVVHGYDDRREGGMDELSVLGATVVSELRADGRRDSYTVEPEDFGLRRAAHGEIAPLGDLRSEAVRFLQVLGGRGHEACGDAACLNAAAVLYVSGQAADLGDGLAQAREAVASGAALAKLEEWVAAQAGGLERRSAGEARLAALRAEAGLPS